MTTEPDYDPIKIDGVTKVYGSTVALDGVDLRIESGDFHCLVGPNGSGKTTLFRLILGHTKPTSGRVRVPRVVLGCGFQQPSVYSDLTVNENLSVFGALSSARDEEWVDSLLEALRLHRVEDRVASELSDGYAKKLDIALALMEKPD
ncbi:MAG: ABC transporter ATP-binding protein, partial [Halobacteria archaeon]|nr:ABC transporter ATP-binding protein [Halobacteria archaeon]